jgi:HPt (histidine-containing phosphotransfer) domain-containing protein
MESTLLDQIRHLCRDRAAYERLKAILVQQERVFQLSWEERQEKLLPEQVLVTEASNIFSNILAREKALAQLAEAIQRSPSLELVLQVAVQVAQKVLQIDRVAIFRRHPDGRGEFVTDAIASGLASIADMPERQLVLSRHMIESMQAEQSSQTVDNIRSSSLSSHFVTLLQQIGISTYAVNKIYEGHATWGTLVAFHGNIYHSWSESDRTYLSLLSAQIGTAISLSNLRQQSQTLTDDVQNLQTELDGLQKIVSEMISSEPKTESTNSITLLTDSNSSSNNQNTLNTSDIAESFNNLFPQDITEEEPKTPHVKRSETDTVLEIEGIDEETSDTEYIPILQGVIAQNGLPLLFMIPVINTLSHLDPIDSKDFEDANEEASVTSKEDNAENSNIVDSEHEAIIGTDNLEVSQDHVPMDPETDDAPVINAIASDISELSQVEEEPNTAEPEINGAEIIVLESSKIEDFDPPIVTPEISIDSHNLDLKETDLDVDQANKNERELDTAEEISSPALEITEIIHADLSPEQLIESENSENGELNQVGINQDDLRSSTSVPYGDDREPAIEPQFIATILSIANHRGNGVQFLLDVIDTYLEEAPILVQALDKAIAVNDHPRLLQTLNKLRSNSDYIGALPLSYQCRQLESAVKAKYTVLIYACLSQVAIESQRATEALRIERSHYI